MTTDVLGVNKRLLESIVAGDWSTYKQLVDSSVTCFEPEAVGHMVEGLDFHKYYFDLSVNSQEKKPPVSPNTSMVNARVRMMGAEAAVVTYVRLTQCEGDEGQETKWCEETRVWQKLDGNWKNVHVHRSVN